MTEIPSTIATVKPELTITRPPVIGFDLANSALK